MRWPWQPPAGSAWQTWQRARSLPALRAAQADVRWKGQHLQRLIIGFGQVHPILQGRISPRQAKHIADVQTWIAEALDALHAQGLVTIVGQEGLQDTMTQGASVRLSSTLLQQWQQRRTSAATLKAAMRGLARSWQQALARHDAKGTATDATLLSATTVLQAEHPGVSIVAIEQQGAHGPIGEGIGRLQALIDTLEHRPAWQSFRKKQGRGLTREEYDAAMEHASLVKQFNTLLQHPERDRAIFREMTERAEGRPCFPFLLGIAHRSAQLQLARQYLPDDVLYVWLTPPCLLPWWKRHPNLCGSALAALCCSVLIWRWLA